MEVTDLTVAEDKKIRGLKITLIVGGTEFTFTMKKKIARRLMRAIFLQIGIDPRYTGLEEVVKGEEEKKERNREYD